MFNCNILTIQALDFDIWGLHIKANLMMSVLILIAFVSCWVWYKRCLLKQKSQDTKFNQEFNTLIENRKKPTWCQLCDINMEFTKLTRDGFKSSGYICPKCKLVKKHQQ